MDYCHSNTNPFSANNYAVKSSYASSGPHRLVFFSSTHKPPRVPFSGHRQPLASSNCEFSSLNTPLEPRSAPGKYLSRLLLNDDTEEFQEALRKQLERLAVDRADAIRRADLRSSSDEACLHSCRIK